VPLFQEFSFLGVSWKKEIDRLRTDVREQILTLKSEIHNTINQRAEISPNIYLRPPADSELPLKEKNIEKIVEQILTERGVEKTTPKEDELTVPPDATYLFSVRYAIENELNRIINTIKSIDDTFGKYTRTIIQKLDFMKYMGWLTRDYIDALRDVLAICNAAIHGEDISEAKINFVRDISPGLIETLKIKADELEERKT
jgi:hypothetical protein